MSLFSSCLNGESTCQDQKSLSLEETLPWWVLEMTHATKEGIHSQGSEVAQLGSQEEEYQGPKLPCARPWLRCPWTQLALAVFLTLADTISSAQLAFS